MSNLRTSARDQDNVPSLSTTSLLRDKTRQTGTTAVQARKGKKGLTSWRLIGPAPKLYLLPKLVDREYKTGSQIVSHLGQIHPHSQWLKLVPRRLGHHDAADSALAALANALDYNRTECVNATLARSAYVDYGKAVSSLQSDLLRGDGRAFSDGSLICITALSIFETIMQEGDRSWHTKARSHWRGINAVLRARSKEHNVSDVARAIIYSLSLEMAEDALGRGETPICEKQHWLALEPPAQSVSMSMTGPSLGKLAYQLTARYPRLLHTVRALRSDPRPVTENVITVLELAVNLLAIYDDVTETAVLRRTSIRRTQACMESKVVPHHLLYHDPQDLLDSVNYWYMRMCIINCSLKILELHPAWASGSLNRNHLQAEKDRYFINTMMSWHHAAELGPFAAARVSRGLLQNWQHLRNTSTWRGMQSDEVLEWILPRLHNKMFGWANVPTLMEDFDLIVDILVGGSLQGFLALGNPTGVDVPLKTAK